MVITITPARLKGTVTLPPSKSQAHRLLLAAGLSRGNSRISNLAFSQDMEATLGCMRELGAAWASDGAGALSVTGTGRAGGQSGALGELHRFDCGESGSTLRFLIPTALAVVGGGVFTGGGRLMERPQTPYFEIFREKGIAWTLEQGRLTVEGALTPGTYALRGDVSSQFITGLLYALPLLQGDSEISLTTALESRGYVDLTLEALSRFGVAVSYDGKRKFSVPGNQHYTPCDCTVEGDWSQAGFYCAANGIGSQITLQGLSEQSVQGDRIVADYARRLNGGGEVTLDVADCPDLVPALALRAALRAGQETHIVGAGRLRIKESDRLDTVTSELCRLGADVEQGSDFLEIRGCSALTGGVTRSHNDHRIAMMLAMAATCATGPVTILDAGSVAKSYPNFWQDYAALGGQIEVIEP